jgi:type IV pilus assembly protein PilX
MSTRHHFISHASRKQQGSTLIVATIFLMIITMIVISVLGTGTLEERMSANDRNRQVALQAGEAILREAEALIETNVNNRQAPFGNFDVAKFTSDCTAANAGDMVGLCDIRNPNLDPRWQIHTWTDDTKTRQFASNTAKMAGIPDADQPRYIIELVSASSQPNPQTPCSPGLVNITARGIGRDDATVFVQSTVRFKPASC